MDLFPSGILYQSEDDLPSAVLIPRKLQPDAIIRGERPSQFAAFLLRDIPGLLHRKTVQVQMGDRLFNDRVLFNHNPG